MEKVGVTDSCSFLCDSGISEDLCLLECSAILIGKWLPAFQRSFLSPSSGSVPFIFMCINHEMEMASCSEMSVTVYL
jgi:hypothetical protein